jgi:agmatine/peptidylarginine deiminase
MGWPDSGYLWREDAKPAQEQYANIAKAISEFEPLTMFANRGPVIIITLTLRPLNSKLLVPAGLLLVILHHMWINARDT